jgi:hypothetical protein
MFLANHLCPVHQPPTWSTLTIFAFQPLSRFPFFFASLQLCFPCNRWAVPLQPYSSQGGSARVPWGPGRWADWCFSFSQALPLFARLLISCLIAAGLYTEDDAPNHLLVNDYQEGAGIQPHRDGPLYPNVTTVTLLGPALLSLHRAVDEHTPGELLTQVWASPEPQGWSLGDRQIRSCSRRGG